jgi:DNA-directed RNA polymerase subunit RPC12/RpoP
VIWLFCTGVALLVFAFWPLKPKGYKCKRCAALFDENTICPACGSRNVEKERRCSNKKRSRTRNDTQK